MTYQFIGPAPEKRLHDVIAAADGFESAIIDYQGPGADGPMDYRLLDRIEENYYGYGPLSERRKMGVMGPFFAKQLKQIVAQARDHSIVPSVDEHRLVVWLLSAAFPTGHPTFSFSAKKHPESPEHWPLDVITPNTGKLFADQSDEAIASAYEQHVAKIARWDAMDIPSLASSLQPTELRFVDKISKSLDPVLSCLGLGR